ncbi:molybdopterin-binding protein [Mesorhizobium sp. INR15]|uniref:molybdopterin-binding protein n=1 Tax=Mesorhizobium sp. INR15 TaxID=2654248 RepID=UPI0018965F85|nr:molybdopterin-binding protein [Mesorhizobium sp. INR15]QPC89711.1 molybdopterin-dependent oxidoreductase [Mesorhizobium sp. INR15]
MSSLITRRKLLSGAALAAPAILVGCDFMGSSPNYGDMVLGSGEWISYRVQRLIGADSMAREFDPSLLSPDFRTNGNTSPNSAAYRAHQAESFVNWRLVVGGLVWIPRSYSLAELRTLPARSQITRHDCVEGWSAIGKWTGVPLRTILEAVRLRPDARYLVFHCADDFDGTQYYESIDLVDAYHPQTILAYGMNDGDLTAGHGAPVRLRVERQLGYKQAKYVMQIEAVASLAQIGSGRGGYWEDAGSYDWYAGI